MSPRKKEETKSFEENMKRLEEIVSRLERGGGAPASPLSAPRKAARWEEKKADPFPGAPEARKGGPLSIIL